MTPLLSTYPNKDHIDNCFRDAAHVSVVAAAGVAAAVTADDTPRILPGDWVKFIGVNTVARCPKSQAHGIINPFVPIRFGCPNYAWVLVDHRFALNVRHTFDIKGLPELRGDGEISATKEQLAKYADENTKLKAQVEQLQSQDRLRTKRLAEALREAAPDVVNELEDEDEYDDGCRGCSY